MDDIKFIPDEDLVVHKVDFVQLSQTQNWGVDVCKINEAWKVASEEMYKAQAEAQEGGEAPGPDASQNGEAESSDVEDVDFEEVK